MDWWIVIVGGVCALIVVLGAYWTDKQAADKRKEILASPVDQPVLAEHGKPTYLQEDQVRAQAQANPISVDTEVAMEKIADVDPLEGGWASPDFVNDPKAKRAVLLSPLVVVTEAISQMADLVPLVRMAQDRGTGLVVVSGKIPDDVMSTLGVNALTGRLPCLCVVTEDLEGFAQECQAEVISQTDLVAGYLPSTSLGHCEVWVSDSKQTWIV